MGSCRGWRADRGGLADDAGCAGATARHRAFVPGADMEIVGIGWVDAAKGVFRNAAGSVDLLDMQCVADVAEPRNLAKALVHDCDEIFAGVVALVQEPMHMPAAGGVRVGLDADRRT